MMILSTNLQVHPLSLNSEQHLDSLHDVRQRPLQAIDFMLKGLHEPRGFHRLQLDLVVFQRLEDLIRCSTKHIRTFS